MAIVTREWKREDVAAVAAIDAACFLEDIWTAENYQKQFSGAVFCGVVVELDGQPVGYVCGTLVCDDAEILRIAVKPEFQKRGLGGKLLDAFLQTVKEKGGAHVFLEVRKSNQAARTLYESRVFVITRERKKYYADGEDALEMKKEL